MVKMRNPTICPRCGFNLSDGAFFNTLSTRLPWGEYEGRTIKWIIKNDPAWIKFCLKEIGKFELDAKARKVYDKRMLKKL